MEVPPSSRNTYFWYFNKGYLKTWVTSGKISSWEFSFPQHSFAGWTHIIPHIILHLWLSW